MLFDQYLEELKKIKLLTLEEEQALWKGYKEEGQLDCRRRLIENYQPLVFKTVKGWRAEEAAMMDLVQEGTVGLIEAVENYDHTRGVAFSLFASHRIKGRIMNFISKEGKLNWVYMDSPAGCNKEATLADTLVDTAVAVPEQAEHSFLVEQVKAAMERLPVKEQLVLSGVFLDEQEPKDLARSLNTSLSQIYRLQKQGIRRVRGMLSKLMHEMKKI